MHGLGFASVLRDLGFGSSGVGVVMPLVSFNLGVELGQLLIGALALPLMWKLYEQPVFGKRWVSACSMLAALAGSYWLVQRLCFA